MPHGLVVTEDQSKALIAAINDLSAQAEANAVFLTDQGGNIIACVSSFGDHTRQTIAALAAGSFSATRELAGLIGESAFASIYHKGGRSSLYMQSVAAVYLLLVVFGQGTPVGLVKLYVEKSCEELSPLLQTIRTQNPSAALGVRTFEMAESGPVFAETPAPSSPPDISASQP